MNVKPIRFDLKFSIGDSDEYSVVHSMSELEENFNIDELYIYFDSGRLVRWLTVLGETAKAEKIRKISKEADMESQLRQLLEALNFNLSESELKDFCCEKDVQELRLALRNDLQNISKVVEEEMLNYELLINDIIESAKDFAAVKAKVRALLANYPCFFQKDYCRFYSIMLDKCPLAIFAVLMDEKFRKYFLPADDAEARKLFLQEAAPYYTSGTGRHWSIDCGALLNVRKTVNSFTFDFDGESYKNSYFFNATPPAVREVSRYSRSNGEWVGEVDQGKKVMILYCNKHVAIRPYQNRSKIYGDEINGKFLLFDGLEFKFWSSGTPCLLYMEAE